MSHVSQASAELPKTTHDYIHQDSREGQTFTVPPPLHTGRAVPVTATLALGGPPSVRVRGLRDTVPAVACCRIQQALVIRAAVHQPHVSVDLSDPVERKHQQGRLDEHTDQLVHRRAAVVAVFATGLLIMER